VTTFARRCRSGAVGCLVGLAATAAFAAYAPQGGEFQVNSYTDGNQAYPAACAAADGTTMVVWESEGQDGSGSAIRGQRYDSAGAPLGGEIEVNSHTDDRQQQPAVACPPSGDFVVVWESRGQDGDDFGIFGRRFDRNGAPVGSEFAVNTTTAERQRGAATCSDAEGDFVVVWHSYDQDGDGYGVFAQRFDAAGGRRGGEFQVNTHTEYSQGHPAVACSPAGDFVVVWDGGEQDGDGYGIFAQRIDADGAKVGSEFRVNSGTDGGQQLPAVASAGNGDFVVVWESYDDQDGDGYGIFGQRFTGDGTPNGEEFRVNAATMFSQEKAAICAAPAGDFTVAWSSPDEDGSGVFTRSFDAAGAPVGSGDVRVNTFTAGEQGALSDEGHVLAVAGADDGRFLVAWQSLGITVASQDGSGAGVFGQRYVPTGATCPGDCNGDGMVTIDELINGVRIILQNVIVPNPCPASDVDGSGNVSINELVAAVYASLNGCP
jgi:hypothetical protein